MHIFMQSESYLQFLYCTDQSNKCNSNPCMNGGNCLNDVKKFTCQCPADFGGETCSRRKYDKLQFVSFERLK